MGTLLQTTLSLPYEYTRNDHRLQEVFEAKVGVKNVLRLFGLAARKKSFSSIRLI